MSIEHIAVRPGHPDYDTARTTIAGTAAPAVVLRPTDAAEVAASIRHAADNGLELAIRSGGHNALGFGNSDGGVVLDLSRLDGIEVLDGGRVRIGTGANWGSAATRLAEHGLAITSGDTVSVGVGGLTQAGGIGWMVRKYGLTIDNVLAAEVVTAAGEMVRADPETNPELFWGLRGGAGNFGVVTAFEYQAQPVSTVHFGVITYALEDLSQLLKGWSEVMRGAPDELTTTLVLMPGFGEFPAGAVLYGCYCGEDPSAIDPLRTIGTVTSDDVSERAYADVLEEAHPPQGVVPVVGNTLVESLSAECIRAIVTAYDEGGRVVFLRSLGGAVGRVSPEATAFAHRDAEALIVSAKFLPEGASQEEIEAARTTWRTIGEHGVGSYAGFLGSDSPEDLAALYPAETMARLVEVKRVWDPANLFRRNFNIRP